MQGNYQDLLDEIVSWCGSHFTFFFVDPMGWMKVVGSEVMSPLLKLRKSEFLINLMYDFVNRAASIPKHEQDMIALFGKPGKERVHCFLVYLTRHAIGLKKFKEIAEDMDILQRQVQTNLRVQVQSDRVGTGDMFAESLPTVVRDISSDTLSNIKAFLMQKFAGQEVLLDYELWADLLENSDYLPGELQAAMKSLVSDGFAEIPDTDIRKRRKNIMKPNYANKSGRWRFKTQ